MNKPEPLHLDPVWLRQKYEAEGMTTSEIAALVGRSQSNVYKALRNAGIPRRPTGYKAHGSTKAPLKKELYCRPCQVVWPYDGDKTYSPCPTCGKKTDTRDRTGVGKTYPNAEGRLLGLKEWYANPENRHARKAFEYTRLRRRAFQRITGGFNFVCVRCGCNDVRLLEINHKDGGGSKELKSGSSSARFYSAIASGKRPADDLELLCRACNAIHALELRFGPLPMRVVWEANKTGG